MKSIEEKVESYFQRYPQSKEVFVNNNTLFHSRGGADGFSKQETVHYKKEEFFASLKSKQTVSIPEEKSEENTEDKPEVTTGNGGDGKPEGSTGNDGDGKPEGSTGNGGDEPEKTALEILMSDADIANFKYIELVNMKKELGLETEDNKAETLIIALTEKRVELKKVNE